FQAEDGIRDATVTGVQTCALPSSVTLNNADRFSFSGVLHLQVNSDFAAGIFPRCQIGAEHHDIAAHIVADLSQCVSSVIVGGWRSEERREGKVVELECG